MTYRQKLFAVILSFLFSICLSFIVGYYLGRVDLFVIRLQEPRTVIPLQNNISLSISPTSYPLTVQNCVSPRILSKDDYLSPYYVQKGDTLFSVLNKKAGGTSKINELIEINKDVYPGLTIEKPFIEVGWKLYLPPKYAANGSGKYAGVQGNIRDIQEGYIVVNSKADGEELIKVLRTPWTQYVPNDFQLRVNDCVRVVYDIGDGNKAVSVVARRY